MLGFGGRKGGDENNAKNDEKNDTVDYMVRDVGLKLAPLEQLQALNFRLSGLYNTFLIFFCTPHKSSCATGCSKPTGESPIDNLQLPNLMRRKDALLLTVGRRALSSSTCGKFHMVTRTVRT